MKKPAVHSHEGIDKRPGSLEVFGAMVRNRREWKALTLDQLAGATGISKPYLSQVETGRTPGPPSEEKVRAIAKALQLDAGALAAAADWMRIPLSVRKALASEEKPRRADGSVDLDAIVGGKSAEGEGDRRLNDRKWGEELTLRAVPVINRVTAGKAAEFGDMDYPVGGADEYVPMAEMPGMPARGVFALKVTGDSMSPTYGDGEVIIVGPGTPREGDDCVVRLGERENFATTFKRIGLIAGADGETERVRLIPLNPAYAERVVSVAEVTGIYPLLYRLIPAGRNEAGGVPVKGGSVSGDAVEGGEPFTQRLSIEHD